MNEIEKNIESFLYENEYWQDVDDTEAGLWVPENRMDDFKAELYNAIDAEVEGFAERLHKRCDVCAGTHAVRMSNTGWHEPADAEPCDEDVHTYVEAELGKYREANR